MTREEAIWWVNHLFEIRKEEYFNKGMMKDAKEVEEAQTMAIEALSTDAVSREALNGVKFVAIKGDKVEEAYRSGWNGAIECIIENAPSAEAVQGEWIHCSEKMPKELERVNVTWLNHNPPFYYQHIKDIPQTDTAVYYRGRWYWWDATVIDVLAEYGEDCNAEQIDKDIEVVAWMPLPKPYECGARKENTK